MGLIQAALTSAGGVLGDAWKEFFYCDAMPSNVMVRRGVRRTGKGSSNNGNDNIITSGSGIAVADGQCVLIVDQGQIVEVCAEPGEYTYDASTEPSIFSGNLGDMIAQTFAQIGKRFTYGGDTGKDQRIYYFNTKEMLDNKFGTPSPVPFRFVDSKINLDIDVSVRCSGTYSFVIADPLLFYKNVCGNVIQDYTIDEIEAQLKAEFVSALAPALAKLSDLEIRPNQLPAHGTELEEALNETLSKKWGEMRGLRIKTVALNPITLSAEDEALIKNAQRTAMYKDPTMAAANLTSAQADAMKAAASNSAGAFTGFVGMGMAQQAGGIDAGSLYAMGTQQQATQPAQPAPAAPAVDYWVCPTCGQKNQGKFCANCGAKKPAGALQYKCDKCGWVPADPTNPPKFCPECGDPFGDEDVVQ